LKEKRKNNSSQIANIREVKENIKRELNWIFDQIQNVIDKYLIQNVLDSETKVFFLKLKGDYYRYKCVLPQAKR
jgi:hypothetical protein